MGYGNLLSSTTLKRALAKGIEPFRGSEHLRFQNQEKACRSLKVQFDRLETSLAQTDRDMDVVLLQNVLVDINKLLQSTGKPLLEDGYNRLLKRLIHIYTRGINRHDSRLFTATAARYADVIEAISQEHPDYDYSEAVGHLLHYMNQLYQLREKSWLSIFEHLISMPESIRAIQLLKNRHLNEIQQWITEGVHNLFQLRDDQLKVATEITEKLLHLEERIDTMRRGLEETQHARVVPISIAKKRQACEELLSERNRLAAELENKNHLLGLLDENIKEFEEKLSATRRACLIHAV